MAACVLGALRLQLFAPWQVSFATFITDFVTELHWDWTKDIIDALTRVFSFRFAQSGREVNRFVRNRPALWEGW